MRKRTKKILIAVISLILLLVIGFGMNKMTSKPAATSPEEKVADVKESVESKEEKAEESVEESSSEEENLDMIEEESEEQESQEEAPEQEAIPEEIEASESEKSIAATEIDSVEEPASEKKEEIQESSPETIKVSGPKEVIPQSTVGMTEYLLPFSNSEERVESTSHVMLHFTSNALNNPQNPYLIEDTYNIFKDYGVSAHYVIDRGGRIYSFVPEDRVAYHAGRGQLSAFPEYNDQLNHYSIGIELLAVGTREEMIPVITAEKFELVDPSNIGYTEAQYGSLNTLLNDIVARHPNIKKDRNHIVGHDEYAPGRKTDPGSLFNWSKIGL